jgi:hypothetical protein
MGGPGNREPGTVRGRVFELVDLIVRLAVDARDVRGREREHIHISF